MGRVAAPRTRGTALSPRLGQAQATHTGCPVTRFPVAAQGRCPSHCGEGRREGERYFLSHGWARHQLCHLLSPAERAAGGPQPTPSPASHASVSPPPHFPCYCTPRPGPATSQRKALNYWCRGPRAPGWTDRSLARGPCPTALGSRALPRPFPMQRSSTEGWGKAGRFHGCWSEAGKRSSVALWEEITSASPPPVFFLWSWEYCKNKQR